MTEPRKRPYKPKGTLQEALARNSVARPSGCIEWIAFLSADGYGKLGWARKIVFAHRMAYEIANGVIPAGKSVCHSCDNPACINAEHLFLGSQADNMADMRTKGRASRLAGERNGRAKLTPENVAFIRENKSQHLEMAALFGVTTAQICRVRKGQQWVSA